jgi:hypothetical protein
MATDALSVSVSEVKRHIAFLERVHDAMYDALHCASSLYLNHSIISAAVTRSVTALEWLHDLKMNNV